MALYLTHTYAHTDSDIPKIQCEKMCREQRKNIPRSNNIYREIQYFEKNVGCVSLRIDVSESIPVAC